MIGGEHAATQSIEEARDTERLGGRLELVPRPVPVGVAADQEGRAFGAGDQLGQTGHIGRVGVGRVADARHRDIAFGRAEQVERKVEEDRATV